MYACLTYSERYGVSNERVHCNVIYFSFLHTEDFVQPGHEFYREKKTTG